MLEDAFDKLDYIIKARDAYNLLECGRFLYDPNIKVTIESRCDHQGYFVSKQFYEFPQAKDHILPMIRALAKRANKRFNEE
jgi:hypothetical protein